MVPNILEWWGEYLPPSCTTSHHSPLVEKMEGEGSDSMLGVGRGGEGRELSFYKQYLPRGGKKDRAWRAAKGMLGTVQGAEEETPSQAACH